MNIEKEQKLVCQKYEAPFVYAEPNLKVGVSKNIQGHAGPINGIRHIVEKGTSGWYIWAGEYSTEPDFFVPIHVEHLLELCPIAIKYLSLAPGWRFQITDIYEDVWEDRSLLIID